MYDEIIKICLKAVSVETGVPRNLIKSKSRTTKIKQARMLAAYVMKSQGCMTERIGKSLGYLNHSGAITAYGKVIKILSDKDSPDSERTQRLVKSIQQRIDLSVRFEL